MTDRPSETATESDGDRPLEWSQGDCVVGDSWFAYLAEPSADSQNDAPAIDDREALDLREDAVPGLMLATQTCDLRRDPLDTIDPTSKPAHSLPSMRLLWTRFDARADLSTPTCRGSLSSGSSRILTVA